MKMFEVVTLFPDIFPGNLGISIFEKSQKKVWDYKIHDLREYGIGPKNRKVDDNVFGHAPGMMIRPDVIENLMRAIKFEGRKIYFSTRGRQLNQQIVEEYAKTNEKILILCGRYEGIDQRAIEYFGFEEICLGNFVLSGAEVAAMLFMEAVIRLQEGVVGNQESLKEESFSNNYIQEPKYTRPAVWKTDSGEELRVDEILVSGDHAKIKKFEEDRRRKTPD
jgi:tRNA (guanine37-N1)-methyltransferase